MNYIPKPIKNKPEFSYKRIVVDPLENLFLSILPYSDARRSDNPYPKLRGVEREELNLCFKVYDEANRRIDKLENKSFRVFTYVTAITASYVYVVSDIDFKQISNCIYIFHHILFVFFGLALFLSLKAMKSKGKETITTSEVYEVYDDNDYLEIEKPHKIDLNNLGRELITQADANVQTGNRIAQILSSVELLIKLSLLGVAIMYLLIN